MRLVLCGIVAGMICSACGDDSSGGDDDEPNADASIDAATGDANSFDAVVPFEAASPSGEAGSQLIDSAMMDAAGDRDGTTGPDTGQASDASGGDSATSSPTESFTALHNDIFAPLCRGCHASPAGMSNLDLSSVDVAYQQLVGVYAGGRACTSETVTRIRVVPGNASMSLLIDKLEPSPACGSRMPLSSNGPFLTTSQIDRVRRWIEEGARKN